MKSIVFSLLFCALLALAAADTERYKPSKTANVVLDLDGSSTYKYIAVEVENAAAGISSVQIKDTRSKTWSSMTYSAEEGYYFMNYQTRINFPISFSITSVTGENILVADAYKSLRGYDKVDTGKQFSASGASNPTQAPTQAAAQPTTKATSAPTDEPTAAPNRATQKAKATTKATAKATKAPTVAPTAKATAKVTAKPASGSTTGCSAPMKMMVPLYTYPGSTWDTVIASAKTVQTVAIINPNSGPGNGPDSAFKTYTKKMNDAGVEMVGYVHTSYGTRSISDVKKEIDIYASEFSYVSGIFLDEASASSAQLSYYQQLHSYIMSLPGFKYNIINPGAVPASGYLNAATQIVSFEQSASALAGSANPSGVSCNNKDQFVAISYGASSASAMQSFLNAAKSKGYYGWAYVNDGSLSGGTYNRIPSYYAQQASYMASLN